MPNKSSAASEMGPPALPIEPALYQKTLSQLQMRSICLDEMSSWCHRETFDAAETLLALDATAEDRQDGLQYNMFITYNLEGKHGENSLLTIRAKFRLMFSVTEPVPDGFFEVFQELNLGLTTMPYFRELVSSMTGRMDLPTLTLPFNIINAQSEHAEEAKELTG